MSTFERRLEALEARAAPSRGPRLIILCAMRADNEERRPLTRIAAGGAESRRDHGEDVAAFLRRLQEVELPKLNPGNRRVWCVTGHEAAA